MERDQREFTDFYTAARDDCLRVVLTVVGDRELAQDLVAEAFTRAWRAWRTVREHPAGRAWIVRTALNTHVSWWRRRRREITVASHDDRAAASPPPALDSSLAAALRRLPARRPGRAARNPRGRRQTRRPPPPGSPKPAPEQPASG